jgi:hypothetical protein
MPEAGAAQDLRRTTQLLFARELIAGALGPHALERPEVHRAARSALRQRVGLRTVDRIRLKMGSVTHLTAVDPLAHARKCVLGALAGHAPRLLIRVDEFPYAGSFADHEHRSAAFTHLDELMAEANIPYLLAITPRVARDVLDPRVDEDRALATAERNILQALPRDRVAFALHGLDHRTRVADPRRRSELDGLKPAVVAARLDRARKILAPLGIEPRVFVPPFNHFQARHYRTLAERFDVICAGPETVRTLGLRAGPVWWQDAVLLPSYPPVYGHAAQLRAGVEALVDGNVGLWVPLVVHWEWEAANRWVDLRRLIDAIKPYVESWDALLDEVRWSRGAQS